MPAATRIATTIEDILAAVRDGLLEDVLPDGSVFLCDSPEDAEAGLAVLNTSAIGVWWRDLSQAAGDYFSDADAEQIAFVTSTLYVTVWNRVNVDRTGRADKAMTSQTIGVPKLARSVILALNDHEITNADDETLTLESLTLRSVVNSGLRGKSHRRCDIAFDLLFKWDLSA